MSSNLGSGGGGGAADDCAPEPFLTEARASSGETPSFFHWIPFGKLCLAKSFRDLQSCLKART